MAPSSKGAMAGGDGGALPALGEPGRASSSARIAAGQTWHGSLQHLPADCPSSNPLCGRVEAQEAGQSRARSHTCPERWLATPAELPSLPNMAPQHWLFPTAYARSSCQPQGCPSHDSALTTCAECLMSMFAPPHCRTGSSGSYPLGLVLASLSHPPLDTRCSGSSAATGSLGSLKLRRLWGPQGDVSQPNSHGGNMLVFCG